jgi:hypothetical protein
MPLASSGSIALAEGFETQDLRYIPFMRSQDICDGQLLVEAV